MYLTKSRFVLSVECHTKLYYSCNQKYADKRVHDAFLKALAEGGFQVGALARCYFPNGVLISELNVDKAAAQTSELLKNENVVIFEGAFVHNGCVVRADVVHRRGQQLDLYEVKAKSFDSSEEEIFLNKTKLKKGLKVIRQDWKKYLYDVAFQKHVIAKSFPTLNVNPFLYLVDKSQKATCDGLNQMFS